MDDTIRTKPLFLSHHYVFKDEVRLMVSFSIAQSNQQDPEAGGPDYSGPRVLSQAF